MTLYFDTKVEFLDSEAVSTIGAWHQSEPLFAVASYSEDRGGSITIFSDSCEPLHEVSYPVHAVAQVSALGWHPEKLLLATGWDNGDIYVWFEGHREFASVHGPHKAPIVLLEFSEQGGRLVTADAAGLLTGWRCDGQYQFLTMFSHDLRDLLLHITFRHTIESDTSEEIANLAKAAVAGDESALDTLTNWRPRTAARNFNHAVVKDNHCFFVGTQSGIIYYINQSGTCSEILNCSAIPILEMMWHPKKDTVICLLADMTIILYLVEATGLLTELDRVKLSGRSNERHGNICWAGNSLAIITGDFTVRIWDIEKSDNYLLKMDLQNSASLATTNLESSSSISNFPEEHSETSSAVINYRRNQKQTALSNEIFTCLAYSAGNQTLCAGTNQGNLFIWRRTNRYLSSSPEDSWQLINVSNVRGAIKQCCWGYNEVVKPCILVNLVSNVYVLKEQPLLSLHTRNFWAVQRASKVIYLENSAGKHCIIQTEASVTALALNELHLVVSNGRCISTYSIEKSTKNIQLEDDEFESSAESKLKTPMDVKLEVKLLQTFNAECLMLQVLNQNIFCLNTSNVMIYSIGGVVLNKILPSDIEGKVIGMDLTSCYLSIFTMNGYIKTYDVSRHDPKLLFPAKSGYDIFDDFGEVIMAKCNMAGTHLAVVIANSSFVPKPCMYCWDFERNHLMSYELNLAGNGGTSGLPVSFYWDAGDPRLLAVEMKIMYSHRDITNKENFVHKFSAEEKIDKHIVESKAIIMFHTENGNLNVLESRELASGEQLINLCVPCFITLDINLVKEKLLQDFVDLKNCDEHTRKLVLNFSLYVAEGKMDLAYRCIRSISSKAIWMNLAKMCVQTNRLDVAKVCMGHLEQARSVRALRQALEDDDLELEAKIAVLAVELGLIDKAKELYRKCGRMDLLNKLLQSCGELDEAIKIAETEDRVHLKNTYYLKALQLKEQGDINRAIEYFEKTSNPEQNVTQLLLDNPLALKKYMQNTDDAKMLKWWGQYIESSGDMETALQVYQKAEDWFSQVKIYCYLGKISKADAIARQSGDRAACYHLARHYENVGKFQEAIMFYTRAQTFANAIRICKENDFQDELWTVASSSRSREKAIAAAYFEQCGAFKRAVELYHRAGMLHKALEMAFESEQPEVLEIIAADLNKDSDEQLINRCADFFIDIEQPQKAVQLLGKTRHLQRALQIATTKCVPITEQLAEILTPDKSELEIDTRVTVLMQLGELLQQQGDYHAATKKFTFAGDKIRAMKCLLKSGNTDKIIFYANMSRQREVYIMAANYLQALDWQNDNNILKHIIAFYSKGQAYDSLANFYAICAQMEIDDYQDYEKALKAMYEAAKCLEKVTHAAQAINNLQRTIAEVKLILKIQNALAHSEHDTVIEECRNMLGRTELRPVRHAHVIVMLVRALVYTRKFDDAARALRELTMREPNWSAIGLIDKQMVLKITQECNLDFDVIWNSGKRQLNTNTQHNDEHDEEIQEQLRH